MNEQEKNQFQAIAIGQLNESPEFQVASRMAAMGLYECFALMKRYGIESSEGLVFACHNGIPIATAVMEQHLRDHM